VQHLVKQVVVRAHSLGPRSSFFKFRNVRAGGERLGAGAAEGDATHFGVAVELRHRGRDAAPHRAVDGVAPRRLVEDDPADGAALFNAQRHGFPEGP
jgi:hypothetical protein